MHLQLLKQYKSFVPYPPNACVGIDWMIASRVIHLSYIRTTPRVGSEAYRCPSPGVVGRPSPGPPLYMISVLHDWQASNLYQHTCWEDKEQTTLETQQILKLINT